jgi:hypothetical protein
VAAPDASQPCCVWAEVVENMQNPIYDIGAAGEKQTGADA